MYSLQHNVAGGGWDEMRNLCLVGKRILLKGRSGKVTSRSTFQPDYHGIPRFPGPALCHVTRQDSGHAEALHSGITKRDAKGQCSFTTNSFMKQE